MMDLGPHAAFIWMAYAAVAIALPALIGWLVWDGMRLRAIVEDLEARGIKRRTKKNS